MILAHHNALEISGSIARRYAVYGAVIDDGAIVSAEVAEEPAETIRLPLPRDVARDLMLFFFEELAPDRMRAVLDELTRPVGPRGHLA